MRMRTDVGSLCRSTAIYIIAILALCAIADGQSGFNINLDAVRKSVVFIHRVDGQGKLTEAGTGFLVFIPTKSDAKIGYTVLVTARHIANPEWARCEPAMGNLVVVLNKAKYDPDKDITGTIEQPLQGIWVYATDDSVDLAAMGLNGVAFSHLDTGNQPINVSELPNAKELKLVDSGSQIASAGLLLGASGTKRNYPIFKFGYVSSIPDEKIDVKCCPSCEAKAMTEWLVAASLVAGNSGSPIVYVPPLFGGPVQRPFLLGVQSASFQGSDVAGLAPVSKLTELLSSMNLPDANLGEAYRSESTTSAMPTSAVPDGLVPGPMKPPK